MRCLRAGKARAWVVILPKMMPKGDVISSNDFLFFILMHCFLYKVLIWQPANTVNLFMLACVEIFKPCVLQLGPVLPYIWFLIALNTGFRFITNTCVAF